MCGTTHPNRVVPSIHLPLSTYLKCFCHEGTAQPNALIVEEATPVCRVIRNVKALLAGPIHE